jgi:hypothetical protein
MKIKARPISSTEQQFNRMVARLREEFPDECEVTEQEANDCFGSKTTVAVARKGSYASWTIWRNEGRYCDKRTSVRSFGMTDGKRVPAKDAMWSIRFNRKETMPWER